MRNLRASLALAALAGLAAGKGEPIEFTAPPPPTPAQTKRWRDQRGYPQTGTGKRQGERVARQVRRAFGDPFAASNRCIAAIKARLA
jgi:hypothetical protein